MNSSFEQFLENGGVILSLPRHEARFRHTKQRLEEVGFQNLRLFNAVDGFHDDLESVAQSLGIVHPLDSRMAALKGITGCMFSHIKIWKKVVDEQLPYLMVFEDDALPHPKFREVAHLWWNITPDVHITFIGNQINKHNEQAKNPQNLIVRIPVFCLHAYFITLEGAKKLMELVRNEPGLKIIDIQLMDWISQGKLSFACWNGSWISEKGYEICKKDTPRDTVAKHTDMIVDIRDTGLIYQNACLGHTLATENPIFLVY